VFATLDDIPTLHEELDDLSVKVIPTFEELAAALLSDTEKQDRAFAQMVDPDAAEDVDIAGVHRCRRHRHTKSKPPTLNLA
jgi:hypothetical protein